MSFNDVFGSPGVPVANEAYSLLSLTENSFLSWPEAYAGADAEFATTAIMHVTATLAVNLALPAANASSVGADFLFRNIGALTVTITDFDGTVVSSLTPGKSVLVYLTDNSDEAGSWGTITYGVGSSTLDAASLVGYGIKAIGASLNQAHSVFETSDDLTVTAAHRARLIAFMGGAATLTLPAVTSIGNDFFLLVRNQGTGVVTVQPNGTNTVDGASTLVLNPGESVILCSSGVRWFTIGHGRSTEFQFTQLVKDVSAGGTITLTPIEASNKLITFVGNPSGSVIVEIPNVVQVFYTYNNISTANTVQFKTAAGTGVTLSQNDRIICFCDGVNVVSAQSAVSTSAVSLIDGSAAAPALFFASVTNTGLYKYGSNGFGISVIGSVTVGVSEDLVEIFGDLNVSVNAEITGTLDVTGQTTLDDTDILGDLDFATWRSQTWQEFLTSVVAGLEGWDLAVSGGTAEQPQYLTYARGAERVRSTIVWGSVGGEAGNPIQLTYEYSSNSGSSYSTVGIKTITYDANGNVTATSWS